MKKKSLALILAVCCMFSQLTIVNAAEQTVYIDAEAFAEDFENYGSNESYYDNVVEDGAAGNHALKLVWTARSSWFSFDLPTTIPSGVDYSVSMKIKTSTPLQSGNIWIAQLITGEDRAAVYLLGTSVANGESEYNYTPDASNGREFYLCDVNSYNSGAYNTVKLDIDATNNTITGTFNDGTPITKNYSDIRLNEADTENSIIKLRFRGYEVAEEHELYIDDIKITFNNPVTFDTDDLTLSSSVDAKVEYKDTESKRIIKAEGTTSHYLEQKVYLKAETVSGTTAKDKTFEKAVAKTGTGASYSFNEELPATVGGEWYDVTVTTDYLDSSKEITKRLYIATLDERASLPTDFSSLPQKTLDEAKTIISGYIPVLLGKESIPEAELEFVAQYFQNLTTPFPAGAEGIAAVQTAYDASTLYYSISNATVNELLPLLSAAEGNRFMSVYEDAEGTLDPVLSENETEFMTHFITKRTEAALLSDTDVAAALRYACAMTKLNNANRSEIQGIVGAYNDIFLLDIASDGAQSVDQNELYAALYSQSYTDLSTIATDFAARVTQLVNEKAQEEANNNRPSGGGGGGGGGGSYQTPVVEPPQIAPPEEEEIIEPVAFIFPDVSKHWAKEYIESLYIDGIISGFEDGSFRPDNIITRAEAVAMLMRAKPVQAAGGDAVAFNDVSENAWYYDDVLAAAGAGIVVGADGSFMPGSAVTREQLAVMIYRVLDVKGDSTELSFADSESVSDYAKEAISYLAKAGIISGYEDNTIRAKKETTRAEMARLLYVLISEASEQ